MDISQSRSAPAAYPLNAVGSYKKNAAAVNGAAVSGEKSARNTDRAEFSSAGIKNSGAASGEKILPERYKEDQMAWKMYYQGRLVTGYELLEIAVKTGAITLDETKTVGYNQSQAEKALIDSKASPAFSWSSSLYSEDRRYVFRVENGQITGMSKAYFDDGTTFFDVAEEIASGKMLCDIDPCKLDWFRTHDKELFDAACRIGSAKRHFDQTEDHCRKGLITEKEYLHDMYPLFLLLFGMKGDVISRAQLGEIKRYFTGNDFAANALSNYSKDNQRLFDGLILF